MHILNILSLLIKRSIECMICILDWKPKYGFHRCWEACNPQNNSLNGCKCNTNMILKTKIFFIRTILQTKRMSSTTPIPSLHTCISQYKGLQKWQNHIIHLQESWIYIQLVHFLSMMGCYCNCLTKSRQSRCIFLPWRDAKREKVERKVQSTPHNELSYFCKNSHARRENYCIGCHLSK